VAAGEGHSWERGNGVPGRRGSVHPASLAAPITFKNRLVQYIRRVTRPYPSKITATVHDYDGQLTPVIASSLKKRAPGYIKMGFPDPRKMIRENCVPLGLTIGQVRPNGQIPQKHGPKHAQAEPLMRWPLRPSGPH